MDVILNGFGKKPLVTVSILVIVIMCLSLCEAAPRPPDAHKKRHNRLLNDNHNIRHHNNRINHKHNYTTALSTSILTRPKKPITPYKTETWKITKTLTNVEKNFYEIYHTMKKYSSGNPSWLPKVNFVSINSETMRRTNLKDRFLILYPRLYQYLIKEKRIFELLQNVTLNESEDFYYVKNRERLITQTMVNITTTISELNDSLVALKLKMPPAKEIITDGFKFRGSDSVIYTQDQIAFSRFQNTIKNWIAEFKCALKPESNFCVKRKREVERRSKRVKRKQSS